MVVSIVWTTVDVNSALIPLDLVPIWEIDLFVPDSHHLHQFHLLNVSTNLAVKLFKIQTL